MLPTRQVMRLCPKCDRSTVHLQPVPRVGLFLVLAVGLSIITLGAFLLILPVISPWLFWTYRQGRWPITWADCTVCGHRLTTLAEAQTGKLTEERSKAP
jgi:hypothetical protein